MLTQRPSIRTLIDEFRALLICKDEQPIKAFWEKHALLRAWYRGGSINFGSAEKPDWRVLSLEECIDDCGLAMYSSASSVYLEMRQQSGVLGAYSSAMIDKSIKYKCFKQALMNYDGEEVHILTEHDPDFLSAYIADNQLSMLDKASILKMLILCEPGKEVIFNFLATNEISSKVFAAYMQSAFLSVSELLKVFHQCISNDLDDIALEMLFNTTKLRCEIGKLSPENTVSFFSTIAHSSLRDDDSFVDEFVGLAKNDSNRKLAIKKLEEHTSLLEGQNNPVLMVLKGLQACIEKASPNRCPDFIKKRAGGDSLMFQLPAKKCVEKNVQNDIKSNGMF